MNKIKNIPQGYKATSLGIIPQEWEISTLNNACNFLDSQRIPIKDSDRIKEPGIYPYYGASGIIDYIKKYIFDDELILLAEDGANIINRSTPIAFLVNGKIWVNNHAHVLKVKSQFNRYYLCAYLESLRYDKYNTGTAQPKLNKDICKKIPVLMPPLSEQQKIAQILELLDKAIEKQSQLIEKLELRKKGLMQQLLTGKRRLPGFATPWKIYELCELFQERNEKNRIDLPLLSISGDHGVILQTESNKRDTSNEDKSKYKRINKGDIGYNTMRMWQGRSALSDLEGIVSPAYTIVTPNKEVDGYYMSNLFKRPRLMYDFWTHSQGLVEDTLNCKYRDFGKVRINCPSYIEQKAISKIITATNHEIELAKQKLELFRQQKHGLMQQLLTGKKRVKL